MKALQKACTALSKENGELEVSDTPTVLDPLPFLFVSMWHAGHHSICFHVGSGVHLLNI
jgi:hypothetical protein